jgi:hypothetical protein
MNPADKITWQLTDILTGLRHNKLTHSMILCVFSAADRSSASEAEGSFAFAGSSALEGLKARVFGNASKCYRLW